MASDSCSEKSNQQDIFLLTGKAIFSAKLSVTRLSQSENQAKVLRSSICISGNSSSDRLTLKRESLLLNALILQIMTLDLNSLLCVKCVNHVLAHFVNNLTLDTERDPTYNMYSDICELPHHILDEIMHFFGVYKELEGKETIINELGGRDDALEVLEKCIGAYKEKFRV